MNTKEYITLGRNDFLNGIQDRSEDIIRDLISVVDKTTIMSILISYFKGYKIGQIEKNIRNVIQGAYYSEDTASIVINYKGAREEVFSKDFISSNNIESIEKARKLVMRGRHD